MLSAAVLGRPAEKLSLVGVTGTNGKTTTTYLIDARAARGRARRRASSAPSSTASAADCVEAGAPLPESSDLQHLFRDMVDAGCTHAVLEVSSHSLTLEARPRLRLQRGGLHQPDPRPPRLPRRHGELLRRQAHPLRHPPARRRPRGRQPATTTTAGSCSALSRGRVLTYAMDREADLRAEDVELSPAGHPLLRPDPGGPLRGADSPGRPLQRAERPRRPRRRPRPGSRSRGRAARDRSPCPGVPGRLERVEAGQDFAVVVDYAHTDDALKNLLETLRELGPRRLITRLRLRRRPRQAPNVRSWGPWLPASPTS